MIVTDLGGTVRLDEDMLLNRVVCFQSMACMVYNDVTMT